MFYGQQLFFPVKSALSLGLGGQSVVIHKPEGYGGNAAILGNLENNTAIINTENKFSGSGIHGTTILLGIPSGKASAFAADVEFYGLPEYNQLNYRIGYGRKLNDKVNIGASGGIVQFNNPGYEGKGIGLLQVGTLVEMIPQVSLGISVHRSFHSSLNYIKSLLLVGIRYEASGSVYVFSEFEKTDLHSGNFKFGFDYTVSQKMNIRSGFNTNPSVFSAGFGIRIVRGTLIDLACSFYQYLGMTPSLGVRYEFSKKDTEE